MLPGIRLPAARPASYQIGKSLRFRSTASAYLNRTFSTGAGATRHAWSFWVKRGSLGATQSIFGAADASTRYDLIYFSSDDKLCIEHTVASSIFGQLITTQVFRDTGAWYHVFYLHDSTDATAANRMRLWVNGVEVTSFSTRVNIASQNSTLASWMTSTTDAHNIGRNPRAANNYCDMYLAEIVCTQGISNAVSNFGQTDTATGAWVPKKYTGAYGTNGFYLPFDDPASTTTISLDRSGNARDWTSNNISVTSGVTYDSSLDTPTLNWVTLNPLQNINNGVPFNGLLSTTATANSTPNLLGSTIGVRAGKWYCEITPSLSGSFGYAGIMDTANAISANVFVGGQTGSAGIELGSGIVYVSNASVGTTTTGAVTAGQVLMLAVDLDNGTMYFGKNGTWENSGNPATGTNPRVTGLTGEKAFACSNYSGNGTMDFTFGQRAFTYTPPSGFLPLNSANLAAPTIRRGDNFFQAVTYTGTGTTQSVTGLRFSPNIVWLKGRTGTQDWRQYDSVRGATLSVSSNLTNAEITEATGLTAFNSDGWTMGGASGNNGNTLTYVSYAWDENVGAGIDIVTYTGDGTTPRSISHGLGVSPAMVIVKSRSVAATQWPVFHSSLTAGNNMFLNLTDAQQSATGVANGGITAVSSTTFTVANGTVNGANVNQNTATYVAYLFSAVAGFSRFGAYTGNGVADGPFAWCGFRPRFVIIKRTDTGNANTEWIVHDAVRSPTNGVVGIIRANSNSAEVNTSTVYVDFLSNGFKIRIAADDAHNQSGGTYAFAAFAEVPFKYANAR